MAKLLHGDSPAGAARVTVGILARARPAQPVHTFTDLPRCSSTSVFRNSLSDSAGLSRERLQLGF